MSTETIKLSTDDGHDLEAYVARPDGAPKGGIVVIQEIFGLTSHIRDIAEKFAEQGYLAIAPAMFDRVKPGIVLDYTDFDAARGTMAMLDQDQCVSDIRAATEFARSAGKVGVIGFCWGGAMADLAACHGLADAGVSYYGRMTVEWLDKQPTCPMLYHYGDRDELITAQDIEKIQRARRGTVHVWGSADHGFCCEDRSSYHKSSATQSMEITLKFFAEHLLG